MRRSISTALVGLAIVIAVTVALTGCSIQLDDQPRDVPREQRRELDPDAPEAGSAVGATRIFLVAPAESTDGGVLRAVLRDSAADVASVLEALLEGPNDAEVGADLTTALPSGLELRSATRLGSTVDVDVSEELVTLSVDASILAVGQIVATASELDGVRAVRLTVEGEAQTWTGSTGEPIENPLTVYDFPGLIESSQPAYPGLPSR